MTDISTLSDRDILVRLDQRVGDIVTDIATLKERVTALERAEDRRAGFFNGARWLWSFLTILPAGTIGFILSGVISG